MTTTRTRQELPPLERLQQRNTAVRENAERYTGITVTELRSGSIEDASARWWSEPPRILDLSAQLREQMTAQPWYVPQDYQARDELSLYQNHTNWWYDKITKTLKPKDPTKKDWFREFDAWHRKNEEALQDQLNTNFRYFRNQKYKKSLEYILLEAIANGKELETKTTRYNPSNGKVYLFGRVIAEIDRDTFKVVNITLPSMTSKNLKLVRHRLRQLGLRCVIVNGINRLYLSEDYSIPLTFDKTVEIPISYDHICLPKYWATISLMGIPRQLDIFGSEWTELEEFAELIDGYSCYVRMRVGDKGIELAAAVNVTGPSTGISKIIEQRIRLGIYESKDVIRASISNIKRAVRDQLFSFLTEDYRHPKKYAGSDYRIWTGTVGPQNVATTITTTTNSGPINYYRFPNDVWQIR